MNILMVGNGKGSWQMRGQQLGAALGARVTMTPTDDDWRWADVAVLIKRHAVAFAQMAHAFGVPIVWDALDFWSQPRDNGVTKEHAHGLLRGMLAVIKPALTIGATQAMADACGGVYLPHHSWAGLVPTPPHETVQTVAYQGNAVYLGRWKDALERECARRGWAFVVNPDDLSKADILVALRDGPWDGWICREWKSGVKLVNAIAAGRPVLTQASAAASELQPPGSILMSVGDIGTAFDAWTGYAPRAAVAEMCEYLALAYRLDVIADFGAATLQRLAVAA